MLTLIDLPTLIQRIDDKAKKITTYDSMLKYAKDIADEHGFLHKAKKITTYDSMLKYAKDIADEHGFLHDVDNQVISEETTLYFWKHFENGRLGIQTDMWEKKLYNFYFTNRKETHKTDESQIAYCLFTHLERLRE